MKTCCQEISRVSCSIVDINKRIQPIQYTTDGILFIDSPVEISNGLSIGGATMSIVGNHINLPAKTLINGVPLLSDAFRNNIISLPITTKINGYYPITEQYYYFYNVDSSSSSTTFTQYRGYIRNGNSFPVNVRTATQTPQGFSFIVPEDCVLTSLKVLYVLRRTFGVNPPSNAIIYIDVVDTNLNPYYTGVFLTITKPAANSRTFIEAEFEYYVQKGDSVAVWVEGDNGGTGSASTQSVTPFLILGYKVLPTGVPLTSIFHDPSYLHAPPRPKVEPSPYNRFPFNNIMNSIAQRPIQFQDQLKILNSSTPSTGIYGRKLTPADYHARLSFFNKNRANAFQDIFAYCFSNQKTNGTFVDFSKLYWNTLTLETQYPWKGILVGENEPLSKRPYSVHTVGPLSQMILDEHEMPSNIDYLSFDLDDPLPVFEDFILVLQYIKFGFMTMRHNNNDEVRIRTRDVMLSHGYSKIFTDIVIGTNNGEWVATEDWYAHPDIADPIMIQQVVDHPDNVEKIEPSICEKILIDILSS